MKLQVTLRLSNKKTPYNQLIKRRLCTPEGNQTLILGTGNLHSIR